MRNKTTWLWIIALGLGLLLVCGGLFGLSIWFVDSMGGGSQMAFGDAVAIVRVEGTILPGEAPAPSPFGGDIGGAYSQQIIEYLQRADKDDDIKAVVLFVDSPGGSVFASDEIALQLNEMSKPVVAAMGSLAASGGYYVSAPTTEIWASPHTLTCSIGVISQFLNVDDFAEEYGITTIVVKSGRFKDTGNPFREFTEADRAIWQAIIDDAYNAFVEVVAEGREMDEATVRDIADGRVCTGQQAQEFGLVDELGYLPDAVDRAAELGGIEGEPRLVEYEETISFLEAITSGVAPPPGPVEELRRLLNYHPGSPLMYLYTGP